MKSNLNNNKGSTLPLVMIIVFVMILLSMALLDMGFIEAKYAINQEQRTQSYYIARSSAHAMAAHIMNNPWDEISPLIGTTGTGEYSEGTFEVTITEHEVLNRIKIESIATTNIGNISRKVGVTLVPRPRLNAFPAAVTQISPEDLIMSGVDAYTDEVSFNVLSNGNSITSPDVKEGKIFTGTTDAGIESPSEQFPKSRDKFIADGGMFEGLDEYADHTSSGASIITGSGSGANQKITIQGNKKIKKVDINNGTLIFDTQGNTQVIVTEKFEIQCDVTVTGGGIVLLFLKEDGSITSNITVPQSKKPDDFIIYLDEGVALTLQTGNASIYSYIYGPKSTIILQAAGSGNGEGFNGRMTIGNLDGEGQSAHGKFRDIPYHIDESERDVSRNYIISKWE